MRNIVLVLIAAALTACAGGVRTSRAQPEQGGHPTADGAAFMGYHGPVWRSNTPAD